MIPVNDERRGKYQPVDLIVHAPVYGVEGTEDVEFYILHGDRKGSWTRGLGCKMQYRIDAREFGGSERRLIDNIRPQYLHILETGRRRSGRMLHDDHLRSLRAQMTDQARADESEAAGY